MRIVRSLTLVPALLLLVTVAAFQISRSRSFQFYGGLVERVETADSVIALTFDDGPTPAGTSEMLAMLDSLRVPATFFLIGSQVQEHPGLARRIVEAGHDVGNHSFSHRRMYFAAEEELRHEIETTDSLLRAAGFRGELYFRPPYGKKLLDLPRYLDRTGRTTVMWDVQPEAAHGGATPEQIVAHALEQTRPGSIILLHVMYGSGEPSRRAVPGIVKGLRARGYRFVTVADLLAMRGSER